MSARRRRPRGLSRLSERSAAHPRHSSRHRAAVAPVGRVRELRETRCRRRRTASPGTVTLTCAGRVALAVAVPPAPSPATVAVVVDDGAPSPPIAIRAHGDAVDAARRAARMAVAVPPAPWAPPPVPPVLEAATLTAPIPGRRGRGRRAAPPVDAPSPAPPTPPWPPIAVEADDERAGTGVGRRQAGTRIAGQACMVVDGKAACRRPRPARDGAHRSCCRSRIGQRDAAALAAVAVARERAAVVVVAAGTALPRRRWRWRCTLPLPETPRAVACRVAEPARRATPVPAPLATPPSPPVASRTP